MRGTTRRSFLKSAAPICIGETRPADSSTPGLRESVYVDSFVFERPGRIQRLNRRAGFSALYMFCSNGHLDMIECGLEFNFDTKRLSAVLAGAVLEHGHWERRERGVVALFVPCSRLPPPPNARTCDAPRILTFQAAGSDGGTLGRRLVPVVNPNMTLVATPDLTNLKELDKYLLRKHSGYVFSQGKAPADRVRNRKL